MGWAERANPNSEYNKKRRPEVKEVKQITIPGPSKQTLWQRLIIKVKKFFYLSK